MEKFKTLTVLLSILSLVLLLMVIFGGHKTTYVCYDGTQEKDSEDCPSIAALSVTQKAADSAVTTYANAYAKSRIGVVANIVNVYRANTSWRSDVLFSNSKTQEVHKVVFDIDGKTSSITCIEGCDYLENANKNTTSSAGTANTSSGSLVVSN